MTRHMADSLTLWHVAGLIVPDFIYNIGTTVLNGGVSMVVFFFVNKVIFPETPKAAES